MKARSRGGASPRVSEKLQIRRLSCGILAVAAPTKGTSFVSVAASLPSGSRSERKDEQGLAHFTEHMLFRGSEGFPTTHALNHALEFLGDGLQGGTSREFSIYSTEAPAENLAPLLEVLSVFFQRPRFSDIEKEKGIVLEEIREEIDERGREILSDNLTRFALLGDHPLAHPILGRRRDLLRVNQQRLQSFYERHYQADRIVVVAAGAVEPERFFELLEYSWSMKLPVRSAQKRAPVKHLGFARLGGAPNVRAAPGVLANRFHFRRQAGSQIEVSITFLAKGDRDGGRLSRIALERVLDDGLASRLQRRLCERRGLLYDVSLSLDSCTDVSFFDLEFRIEPPGLLKVISEVLTEFRLLSEVLVDGTELDRVKGRMRREVQSMFETPRYLAARLAETLVLELPLPLSQAEWMGRIDEVTAQSVRKEARKVFRKGVLAGVLEGPLTSTLRKKVLNEIERGLPD